jgi:hypothetical protein
MVLTSSGALENNNKIEINIMIEVLLSIHN